LFLENGEKFSFKNHQYLHEVYQDLDSPDVTIQKATQLGFTTFGFVKAVWACRELFSSGVIYFFPTKEDVSDFARGRVAPFLRSNPDIVADDVGDVDNVGLKRIGKSWLYFRGMRSPTGMKSVPADAVMFDEIDEADPYSEGMALKRIDHSPFKWVLRLSNPTVEGYGINRHYLETDQRQYHLRCPACGQWTCLETTFPDCLVEREGRVIRACPCGAELDLNGKGEWVAAYPGRTRRGYQISQLYSTYVDPGALLAEYRTTRDLENFYRLRLGRAFTKDSNRLTRQAVLDLQATEPVPAREGCVLGIDQGSDIHVVCASRQGDKTLIHALRVEKDFEAIDRLIVEFNVDRVVLDALPETREARRLRERHPSIVFLNYYNDDVKQEAVWKYDTGDVLSNRTTTMDESHSMLSGKRVIIAPNLANIEEFATQCSNTARKREENERTGAVRFVWVKAGADHFRHAYNYAEIALSANASSISLD